MICPCCGQETAIPIAEMSMMSKTEARIFSALKTAGRWMTTEEIREVTRASSVSSIRVHIMRIREQFGDVIETRPSRFGGGYRLRA